MIRPGQSGRPDAQGNYIVTLHSDDGPAVPLAATVSGDGDA